MQRNVSLDFMRVVACLAVIAIHCADILIYSGNVTETKWLFGNVVESFSRFAVPVFIMISGSLLIGSNNTSAGHFYHKRFTKVLPPLLFWSFAYWLLSLWTLPGVIAPIDFASSFALGNPYPGHMYFIFVILGLYLITPLLSSYAKKASTKSLLLVTVGFMIFGTVWQASQRIWPEISTVTSNSLTMFVPYIGYYIAGYYLIQRKKLSDKNYCLIFIICSTLIAILTALTSALYGKVAGFAFYDYLNPLLVIASVSALMAGTQLYEKIAKPRTDKLITKLSKASFGVYLIHPIFIQSAIKIAPTWSTSYVLLLFISTTSLSFAAVIVSRRFTAAKYILP